jgi:hypothetical protein
MCVPPVSNSRFDKTYLVKSTEKKRHLIGTGDGKRLHETSPEKRRYMPPATGRPRRNSDPAAKTITPGVPTDNGTDKTEGGAGGTEGGTGGETDKPYPSSVQFAQDVDQSDVLF